MGFEFLTKGFEKEGIGMWFNNKLTSFDTESNKISVDEDDEISRTEVAESIICIFYPIFFNGTLFLYRNETGCYSACPMEEFANIVENIINNPHKNSSPLTKAIYDEVLRRTFTKTFSFNPNKFLINFKNRTYDIVSGYSLNHAQEYLCNYTLNANVGTTSKNDFKKSDFCTFIQTICEYDRQKIKLLQEMCGLLLSDIPFKGAIFWIGCHDSGKSTLAKILSKLLSPELISSVPLEKFDDKFRISQMSNTRINIGGEISKRTNSLQWKIFKEITGGDIVNIEAKYCNAVNAVITAKLLFLGNFMPNMPKDEALKDRLHIFNFTYTVPPAERDIELLDKLSAELDIIANWCLQGLVRYVKNNFTFTSCTDLTSQATQEVLDPIQRFIITRTVEKTGEYVITSILYEEFEKFFNEKYSNFDLALPSKQELYSFVKEFYPSVSQHRKKVNGKNEYVFKNLILDTNMEGTA